MERRPNRPRDDHKAGDPAAKPVCCKKEKEIAPQKACKIDPKEKEDFLKKQEKHNEHKRAANKRHHRSPEHGVYSPREMTWKDKHCGPVMFNYNHPASLQKGVSAVREELSSLKGELQERAADILKDAGKKRVERTIEVQGCAVLGGLIGGALGFFFGGVGAAPGAAEGALAGEALCNAASTAEGVVDAASSLKEVSKIEEKVRSTVKKNIDQVKNIEKLAEKAKKISELNKAEKLTKAQKELLEELKKEQKDLKNDLYATQKALTQKDKCLRAKRCVLNTYNEHNKGQRSTSKKLSPKDRFFGLGNEKGCCPGQTAHHIIPETKLRDCPNYQKGGGLHKQAPTVCLEGNKDNGTHGEMHHETDEITKKILEKWKKGKSTLDPTSIDATIEASAKAYAKTFPQCSQNCIKEQLESYYKKKFKGCKLRVVDKSGKPIENSDENKGSEDL